MLASLVADGRLTQDQIDNHLGDMIMNADEIGGNEKGKRKPVYAPAKKNKGDARMTKKINDSMLWLDMTTIRFM